VQLNREVAIPADSLYSLGGTCILPLETPAYVYHYTTIEGLLGILDQKKLWATDVSFMNDASEYDYASGLITNELKSLEERFLLGAGSPDSDLRHLIFNGLRHLATTRQFRVYASCFCEAKNLLSQWRAYSKNARATRLSSTGRVSGIWAR